MSELHNIVMVTYCGPHWHRQLVMTKNESQRDERARCWGGMKRILRSWNLTASCMMGLEKNERSVTGPLMRQWVTKDWLNDWDGRVQIELLYTKSKPLRNPIQGPAIFHFSNCEELSR